MEYIENEKWVDVVGYEGIYRVSNMGRLWSCPRTWSVGNKGAKRSHNGKILNPTKNIDGYLFVNLTKNGVQSFFFVHRLVGLHFIPNLGDKPEINHKMGIKTDNRASELEWSTRVENIKHSNKNGLAIVLKGEQCGKSKLKDFDIVNIRSSKSKPKELASMYNVTISNICSIISGKTWKHIK